MYKTLKSYLYHFLLLSTTWLAFNKKLPSQAERKEKQSEKMNQAWEQDSNISMLKVSENNYGNFIIHHWKHYKGNYVPLLNRGIFFY